jgi:DNA-binding transcriptional MerR regulator
MNMMKRLVTSSGTVASPDHGDVAWTDQELESLELAHIGGLSTHQIVELFSDRGVRLSEATFRKYVQLGLLPRSVRVARKGNRHGSQGLYPASVVRQIDRVRRLMAQGYTILEIQAELALLPRDIEELSRQLTQLFSAFERAVEERTAQARDERVQRELTDAHGLADALVGKLRGLEQHLAMRARMARAAV